MKGYVTEMDTKTLENENFRTVLYTAERTQLVVMSLKPDEDIGEETHELDQFIRCEAGTGKAMLDDVEHDLSPGVAVLVPAGTKHNIINTSADEAMKLYTLYAPPNHRDGVVHKTKADAEADTEGFDGTTTE